MHRRPLIVTSTALLALLAGCGGSPASSSTSAAAAKPSATPTATKTTLADCVVGRWTMDPTSVKDTMTALMAATGLVSPEVSFTGSSVTTVAKDGTYSVDENMAMEVKGSVAGQTMDLVTTSAGTEKGTWKLAGTNLVSTVTDNGLKTSTTINGEVTPETDDTGTGSLPTTPSPVTCDASTLTLTEDLAADWSSGGETFPANVPSSVKAVYRRS